VLIEFQSACIKHDTTALQFREELLRFGDVSIPEWAVPLINLPDQEIVMHHLINCGGRIAAFRQDKDGNLTPIPESEQEFWIAGRLVTPRNLQETSNG